MNGELFKPSSLSSLFQASTDVAAGNQVWQPNPKRRPLLMHKKGFIDVFSLFPLLGEEREEEEVNSVFPSVLNSTQVPTTNISILSLMKSVPFHCSQKCGCWYTSNCKSIQVSSQLINNCAFNSMSVLNRIPRRDRRELLLLWPSHLIVLVIAMVRVLIRFPHAYAQHSSHFRNMNTTNSQDN